MAMKNSAKDNSMDQIFFKSYVYQAFYKKCFDPQADGLMAVADLLIFICFWRIANIAKVNWRVK